MTVCLPFLNIAMIYNLIFIDECTMNKIHQLMRDEFCANNKKLKITWLNIFIIYMNLFDDIVAWTFDIISGWLREFFATRANSWAHCHVKNYEYINCILQNLSPPWHRCNYYDDVTNVIKKTFALEFVEKREELFPWYYKHSDVI